MQHFVQMYLYTLLLTLLQRWKIREVSFISVQGYAKEDRQTGHKGSF